MESILNFIDGKFVPAVSGRTLDNVNPSTGEVFAKLPDSDEADISKAVHAAERAFPSWSKLSFKERSSYLNRIADVIESHSNELTRAESRDQGKPLWLAQQMDIPRSILNFRFFAQEMLNWQTREIFKNPTHTNTVIRSPLGVVGLISPWNLPLYLLTWKIAPALAAGNTVVAKPSELTPLTAFLLGNILNEAGLPPGVVNIVHGQGATAGAALVSYPQVRAISFTGGTATGKAIQMSVSKQFKKLSLELGGKNPTVIWHDVDLEKVVPIVARASFLNQGEICLCGSRIFVHSKIYSDFLNRFRQEAKGWKVGDPFVESTKIGPLVSRAHLEKVQSYVSLARELGGTVELCGESGGDLKGFFHPPTIITGLAPECRVNQEEIFGPVVTLTPYSSEDEVVAWANGVPYGLSASVWAKDQNLAERVAQKLEVGTVWINCWMVRDLRVPFGGVKQSGLGREGGRYSFEFFSEVKTVCSEGPS